MFREVSVRKLAWGLLYFVLIPMIAIVLVSTAYQAMNEQQYATEAQQNLLRMASLPIAEELERVDTTIVDLLQNNTATSALARALSTDQFYRYVYAVKTALQTVFHTSETLDMMMFYFSDTNILLNKDEGFPYLTSNDKLSIISNTKAKFMKDVIDDTIMLEEWNLEYMDDALMLRHNVGYEGVYCAALFNVEEILKQIYINYNADTKMFFVQNEQVVAVWPEDSTLQMRKNEAGQVEYVGSDEHEIAVTEDVLGLTLVCVTTHPTLFHGVEQFTLFLVGVAVLLLLMLILFMVVMRQRLMLPMGRLADTMNAISAGDMNARALDASAGQELKLVNNTFNQMIEHIQNLKIAQYEQQLALRQTQIQYYQAQIRPHFYLNCLKNLYSLAQQNEMKHIEESILLLSNHLRYCFQWGTETVTLKHEIEMCKNYIDLMSVTAQVKPTLKLDVDAACLDCSVPPVSLLTLVENCLKHGVHTNRACVVEIRVRILDGDDVNYLQLGVYDDGIGFSEQQLMELNSLMGKRTRAAQNHVGICNVLQRFQLLYDGRFNVAFSNQGGAAVEFFIEQDASEQKERD